jgi:hypothetical protein
MEKLPNKQNQDVSRHLKDRTLWGMIWILVLMNTVDHKQLQEKMHTQDSMEQCKTISQVPRYPNRPSPSNRFSIVMNYRVSQEIRMFVTLKWRKEASRLQDVSSESEETSKGCAGKGEGLVGTGGWDVGWGWLAGGIGRGGANSGGGWLRWVGCNGSVGGWVHWGNWCSGWDSNIA